jgi:3-isopropylmalate/(R)-2-methylmalate dehydratase small subunit
MEPFIRHQGLVAPMDRANVDTDQLIPKQYLKSILRTGYGPNLFDEWRYLDPDRPGTPVSARRPNPEFVLNLPRYRGASVLLARRNFGCGSSREHAPWALGEFGFRAVVAPSFGDIFFNNCLKNGLLPVVLPEETIDRLFGAVAAAPGYRLTIDLEQQVVIEPGGERFGFEIDPSRRESLLHGWDEIGLTLKHADEIRAFEARRLARMPWLVAGTGAGPGSRAR